MMKTLILITMMLLLIGRAGAALAEGAKLPDGLELKKPYKKAGENNPLFTQRFGADPGVMEYNGRLYVYLTDDVIETGADGKVRENSYSQIVKISCLSSDDLVNWTDHGLIPVAGPAGIAWWAVNSWAPCAAHKTIDGKERFFLYFCNGGNGIGVLSSDSPEGPWEDPLGHLLITRSVPNCGNVVWLFDPAVMVDEDGTGYLAFGGGVPQGKQADPGTGRIVRLAPDMIHLDGDPVTVDAPWLFEDSGLNRINGKYIYSYCSNWQTKGNNLRLTDGAIQYMTADDPLGPYTYAGELFPNEGRFFGLYGNNHHSIACLNGQYYLFYHSRPVEKAMNISGNYRSPQVDMIRIGEDGMPEQVKGTMKGPEQLKPLDPYAGVSACTMASQAGLRFTKGDGWQGSSGTGGCWLRIAEAGFGEGTEMLTVRAMSETGGDLYLMTGGPDGTVAAKIPVPVGTEPAETECPLALNGVQDVWFVFGGEITFVSWQVR